MVLSHSQIEGLLSCMIDEKVIYPGESFKSLSKKNGRSNAVLKLCELLDYFWSVDMDEDKRLTENNKHKWMVERFQAVSAEYGNFIKAHKCWWHDNFTYTYINDNFFVPFDIFPYQTRLDDTKNIATLIDVLSEDTITQPMFCGSSNIKKWMTNKLVTNFKEKKRFWEVEGARAN